jgi:hypothetical protein
LGDGGGGGTVLTELPRTEARSDESDTITRVDIFGKVIFVIASEDYILSNRPTQELDLWQEIILALLSGAQVGLDVTEAMISLTASVFASAIVIPAAGAASLEPTIVGEIGVGILNGLLTMPADGIETMVGWGDFGLNAMSDIISGATYIDKDNYQLVIGQDTIVTLAEQLVDGMFRSSQADVVINAVATSYDVGQNIGYIPTIIELRICFTC